MTDRSCQYSLALFSVFQIDINSADDNFHSRPLLEPMQTVFSSINEEDTVSSKNETDNRVPFWNWCFSKWKSREQMFYPLVSTQDNQKSETDTLGENLRNKIHRGL